MYTIPTETGGITGCGGGRGVKGEEEGWGRREDIPNHRRSYTTLQIK